MNLLNKMCFGNVLFDIKMYFVYMYIMLLWVN